VSAPIPALVTGATGFLGSRLAAFLAKRGYDVRALARRTSDFSRLQGSGATTVHGDLADRASLIDALRGISSSCPL